MDSWVVNIQAKLDSLGNGPDQEEQLGRMRTLIYKVPPAFISNINKRAFQPRVVSFGPYHHGKPHLASMEAHKERALLHYIHQSGRSMRKVFDLVAEVAQELKDSYDSLDSQCRHRDLVLMLLIRTDMLMLENQLLMTLLLKLKGVLRNDELENDEPVIKELNADILWFLDCDISNSQSTGKCLHVLDLYRKSLLHIDNEHEDAAPQSPDQGAPQSLDQGALLQSLDQGEGDYPRMRKCLQRLDLCSKLQLHTRNKRGSAAPQSLNQGEGKAEAKSRVGHNVVRPAIELHEAGVRFKKSKSESLRDITFYGGILRLPHFMVDDYTESIFLNLIAFERCYIPAGNDISSFIAFMDCIIDDGRELLSSKGIIENLIGTGKEAANLFNTMSKDLAFDLTDNLDKVHSSLIDYCDTPCHKWRANLTQTYFRSPWTIISVIAAFVLFSLTAVQTIFTILH